MSKKHKNRNRNINTTKVEDPDAQTESKKTLKPVPKWKDDDGTLLKLKRSDFPYNRAGIIAYCDFRIEYWNIKKADMLKKADPLDKVRRKREKLLKALKEVEAQLNEPETNQETSS
ncbi:hypothetical protein LCGC14_1573900 [marine sediment metagenome]|uniref:Uncharacterized protein n=1 Tax=marine sediment metagenome TaxID=412755 RepID=A0A0F9IIZ7_9ZZZZ